MVKGCPGLSQYKWLQVLYLRYLDNLDNFKWSRWESFWWQESWQIAWLVNCTERQWYRMGFETSSTGMGATLGKTLVVVFYWSARCISADFVLSFWKFCFSSLSLGTQKNRIFWTKYVLALQKRTSGSWVCEAMEPQGTHHQRHQEMTTSGGGNSSSSGGSHLGVLVPVMPMDTWVWNEVCGDRVLRVP